MPSSVVGSNGGFASILVTNISASLDEKHLRDLFGECGDVQAVELMGKGSPSARCVLSYDSEDAVRVALLLDGMVLGGLPLKVTKLLHQVQVNPTAVSSSAQNPNAPVAGHVSASSTVFPSSSLPQNLDLNNPAFIAAQKRSEEVARTLYIGNLFSNITASELREFFSKVAKVSYVKLAGNPPHGTTYAFVEFETINDAMTAKQLQGSTLGGLPVKIGPAQNPIVKTIHHQENGSKTIVDSSKRSERSREEVLRKLREAQEKLAAKYKDRQEENEGLDEKKSVRSRSPSESRSKYHRRRRSLHSYSRSFSRSRSRSNDRYYRKSRDYRRRRYSRSRSPRRRYNRRPGSRSGNSHEGMYWDGFQWLPVGSVSTHGATGMINPAHLQHS